MKAVRKQNQSKQEMTGTARFRIGSETYDGFFIPFFNAHSLNYKWSPSKWKITLTLNPKRGDGVTSAISVILKEMVIRGRLAAEGLCWKVFIIH